ncbi:phosphoglycerate dehydrogenase [Marivibrio halodurans]|uniref:D-3-phosphoglycerate dehydrogenase n=1 Tax=Marivibrio halodurans TaxID=2039722 RepID=A0A8J7V2M6_9PROT|nr:phosphoglycerate dehydrogenase [Marivibrio halodurans]MBP5858976.1 phosphoglycerate dehydrogenase [Marivibrio halodurans]
MSKIANPSVPKHELKFLLLEGIANTAVEQLAANGYRNVEHLKTALDEEALIEALQDVRFLGVRSRSKVTRRVIESCPRLAAIGCFSVGTNQVDLEAAHHLGIPVFNAPFSNTRSVAELTIAETVMLMRRTFPRAQAAHEGRWDKSATGSFEVRGKTLGIVGYGNIGSQLAVLAESMGMRVVYYDHTDRLRHGNAEPMESLDALLERADVVTLHVPATAATEMMIGAEQIARMRPGSYLINNARGTVVDIDALAAALRDGHLAGAAIDVFPKEPGSNKESFESALRGLDNVILTPHVGGSTEEAQERIGDEVARKLIDYSDVGTTVGAVNFPEVQLPRHPAGTRFIQVQRNVPGELGRMNEIFARNGANIAGQYYQTQGEIGYVVLDSDGSMDPETADELVRQLRALTGTIRARVLL